MPCEAFPFLLGRGDQSCRKKLQIKSSEIYARKRPPIHLTPQQKLVGDHKGKPLQYSKLQSNYLRYQSTMTQIFDTVCLNLNTYTEEIYYNIWHCNKYTENCFDCNNIALFCTDYMN